MKKYNTGIQIVYGLSCVALIFQTLLILGAKYIVDDQELFPFGVFEELGLIIHCVLVVANFVYLIERKNEPEKWMTIINSVVNLFSLDIGRDLLVLAFLYSIFINAM